MGTHTTIQSPAPPDDAPAHSRVRSLGPGSEGGYGRGRSDFRALRLLLLFPAVDALMLALAVAAATLAPLSAAGTPPVAWSVAYGVAAAAALASLNAYSQRLRTDVLDTLRGLLGAVVLAAMVVLFAYVFTTEDGSGAHQIAGLAVYAFGFLAAGRLAASSALLHGLVEHDLRRRALILGAGKIGNVTARRLLAQPDLGLQPVGFLDDDPLEMPGETAVLPVLGGPPDLDRIVAEHDIEHFIVGFSMASHQLMLGLVRRCWELGVSVSLVPRLFEVAGDRPAVDRLGGLPLVSLAAPPSRSFGLVVKSAIDRAVAAVAILLLSPLLLLVSVAIRLSMGSPVMYRQHRVGRDGAHFVLWKFRTMLGTPETAGEGNAEWAQAAVASAGDVSSFGGHAPGGLGARVPAGNRCTSLGSFLRRTSIDELPQLWNVLRGDMSLIGPRPEMPHYVERFEEAIYRYSDRHRVKSGLTGWAQVHGLRGDTSLTDRVEWDNYYIENWSLWLDFKIALRTVQCIVRDAADGRSGAEARQCDTLKPVPHPTAPPAHVHEP